MWDNGQQRFTIWRADGSRFREVRANPPPAYILTYTGDTVLGFHLMGADRAAIPIAMNAVTGVVRTLLPPNDTLMAAHFGDKVYPPRIGPWAGGFVIGDPNAYVRVV